ncbi:hypothetical protein C7974DRAFT_16474 [Boeremia exigua]|uniref:uncharacterized protein n=1 Tax=Boeremia exigua TaxID=749465 RepID=UPI001E8D3967|nr:uncharacterized protein C7974DRAFT_16474 [Boeremia exigua]KAH6644204.1 hypothetical protein C7974DRAFT_16474 [Boeremia exigua]
MTAPYPNFGEPLPAEFRGDQVKKRRWLSRSDEEIAEHMDTRNLRYRKGWPQLPPLPVADIRDGARNKVHNPQAIINTVETLCQAQRIQPIEIYFAYRVPEVQQEDEKYHTLVLTTDLSKDPLLYSLIIHIRKFLQQDSRHQEISIEIIDYRAVHGLFSFAIPPSELHLMEVWHPVFDAALEEIHKRQEKWTTVEMLYRGLEDDAARCQATVVITSPTAAKDVWIMQILPDIRKRLQALSPSLGVELLCGSSLYINSRGVPPDAQTYEADVSMGSSIGQQALEMHSGTAGGMVKLSDGTTCALTNHHVVRNDSLDKLLTKSSGEHPFLKAGNPAFEPSKHRFTCPSNEDNAAFIQDREKYEQQWLAQARNPAAPRYLASTRAELTTARTTNRSFGTVYASSGLRTVKCEKLSSNPTNGKAVPDTGKSKFRFMLDWSLLELHPKRGMVNVLPMRVQNNNARYSTLMSGQECAQWTVMNNPKCHILRDEVTVGKFGRTTGFTYGVINSIPTIINPNSEGGQYKNISDTYGFTVEDCGHSMSFVAHGGAAVGLGDSGSIVLHAPSGEWLGLLFGETRAKAALFTPIDLIFRDIEKVTELKVVEPVFNCG